MRPPNHSIARLPNSLDGVSDVAHIGHLPSLIFNSWPVRAEILGNTSQRQLRGTTPKITQRDLWRADWTVEDGPPDLPDRSGIAGRLRSPSPQRPSAGQPGKEFRCCGYSLWSEIRRFARTVTAAGPAKPCTAVRQGSGRTTSGPQKNPPPRALRVTGWGHPLPREAGFYCSTLESLSAGDRRVSQIRRYRVALPCGRRPWWRWSGPCRRWKRH